MTFDAEAIYAALFALVSPTSVYAWAGTPARRLKLWGDVPLEQRPILYQFEGLPGRYEWKANNAQPVVRLEAKLFIYTNAKDQALVGATQLNQIMTAVSNALNPAGRDAQLGRQTLGGLVYFARIEGEVFRDPGDLDGDGMMILPVVMNVNA